MLLLQDAAHLDPDGNSPGLQIGAATPIASKLIGKTMGVAHA